MKLRTFISNFDLCNNIEICDKNNLVLYKGIMNKVPDELMYCNIIKGTAKGCGQYIVINVK